MRTISAAIDFLWRGSRKDAVDVTAVLLPAYIIIRIVIFHLERVRKKEKKKDFLPYSFISISCIHRDVV
jgi:hypothetical protein